MWDSSSASQLTSIATDPAGKAISVERDCAKSEKLEVELEAVWKRKPEPCSSKRRVYVTGGR